MSQNNHIELSTLSPEEIGDQHLSTGLETPLRPDAFELSDQEKINIIEECMAKVMHTLGLDLQDVSLKGTPHRIAKMYVQEMFSGLKPENKPKAKVFPNEFQYNRMLVEKNITLNSACEHHFLPIVGKAHVAYISSGMVIGLSKINRIVDYYARRPQGQERLTMQILRELQQVLDTEDVIVMIDAKHLCVSSRGVEDNQSSTVTVEYGGKFEDIALRKEFLDYLSGN